MYKNCVLCRLQEAGEGDPVPDREGLRVGHAGWHRQVHSGEERTEQADDRRVPGQPAAVQQGRPGVSTRRSRDRQCQCVRVRLTERLSVCLQLRPG